MGTLTKKVIIKIDGNEYKGEDYEEYNFLNISLTQKLLSPNELRFTMQKKAITQSMSNSVDFPTPEKVMGANVYCRIYTESYDDNDELNGDEIEFNGIVFNVDVYPGLGTFSEQLVDVIAYSSDFLLDDHPHCYSYEDMTLKDIVTKTLNPHRIESVINPRTTAPIPYTVQYNESNYQFLTRLAQRYGEWMYHDGKQWIFGKIKEKDVVELHARNDIINYKFQSSLVHHKLKHAHHNYIDYNNPMKSDSDFPDLTAPKYHHLTDTAKKESAKWFNKETFQHLQCSNPEVSNMDELEISAKAQLFGEKTKQTVCNGSSVRSSLTIGSRIKIFDVNYVDGINDTFVSYEEMMITGIVHSTETNGHYTNTFTAVPSKSEYPPYFHSDVFPHSAAQRAKVMDNDDPEKLGRIRVQFLWQENQDSSLMTPWIRIAQPHGGDQKGFYFIPEIDEEVIVDFENGNAEKPYVAGTLWHGLQRPKDSWTGKQARKNTWGQSSGAVTDNSLKGIRTRNGHTIAFFDDPSTQKGQIVIADTNDNYIRVNANRNVIQICSHGDIELFAGHDIIMQAENDIIQKAGNNRLSTIASIDNVSSGSHNYKAEGAIHMKGKTFFAQGEDEAVLDSPSLVQIQSGATANVLGNSSVYIGSGGAMDVSAASTMTLEASTVNIN